MPRVLHFSAFISLRNRQNNTITKAFGHVAMSQDSSKEDGKRFSDHCRRVHQMFRENSTSVRFSKQIASNTSSSEKATEDRWEADKEDWMDESKESRDADECVFKVTSKHVTYF